MKRAITRGACVMATVLPLAACDSLGSDNSSFLLEQLIRAEATWADNGSADYTLVATRRCDCGGQLAAALEHISKEGGVLLYLRQEGRGIGLANKLRAYALQDRGFDTVEANLRLGFADDERDHEHAAAILRELGIAEVRLLTNNPAKVAALEAAGVQVTERVAHSLPSNPHNERYLAATRDGAGHLL